MLTGDIGRTAILAREDRLGDAELDAVPPAQVHARVAGRGRGGDPRPPGPDGVGRGQVRRHPRPAPPRRRRGPALLPRPPRHQRPVPRGRRGRAATCRGPGSSTASCSPGRTASVLPFLQLQARLGRKNPSREDPRRGPGDLRRVGRAGRGPRPGRASSRRCSRSRSRSGGASSRASACRSRPRAAGSPSATSSASTRSIGLEAAFAEARARRNEGLMVKDPDSRLLAGPPRAGLAEDEEGAGDARLRGGRRRGRARQAPRRAVRLHVRGPRRGQRQPRDHRQGVQRPDRRRDRRDDQVVRGPHDQRSTAGTGWWSRSSWSRSRST